MVTSSLVRCAAVMVQYGSCNEAAQNEDTNSTATPSGGDNITSTITSTVTTTMMSTTTGAEVSNYGSYGRLSYSFNVTMSSSNAAQSILKYRSLSN